MIMAENRYEQRQRNADQEWSESLKRNRGEDIYGEGDDDDRKDYRDPTSSPFRNAYDRERGRHLSGFRQGDRIDEGVSDYGRVDEYNRGYIGEPEKYRNLRDRQRDDGRGDWWAVEPSLRRYYRSNRQQPEPGMHKGKGPRNYRRSDERIRDEINGRLSDDPFLDASDVEIDVNNCEVTMTGTVEDRNSKRRAEDLIEEISGVRNVQNSLRVQSNPTR